MDCFLLLSNNMHNFTELAALSPHLWCRFQEKLTWLRQKALGAAFYHIISVWEIFAAFSATRDSIWIWIMTEKCALSILRCNQRSHNALNYCGAAIVLQRLDGGVLCFKRKNLSVIRQLLSALGLCLCMSQLTPTHAKQALGLKIKNCCWMEINRNCLNL